MTFSHNLIDEDNKIFNAIAQMGEVSSYNAGFKVKEVSGCISNFFVAQSIETLPIAFPCKALLYLSFSFYKSI